MTKVQEQENFSLSGKLWRMAETDDGWCTRVAQAYGVPFYVAQLLYARHVAYDDIPTFLQPKLKDLMPEPYVLKDMQRAAERVADAIMNGEKIAIIGDYDVDGATSTSELKRFFRAVGVEPMVHIPSREEGYGPSDLAFAEFKQADIKLVITIDCGTTAFEPLNKAAREGFEIIVLDHHEAEAILPAVYAVVNPKRLDETNPYKYLEYMSAVGVGFMFLVAVNRLLRQRGFYATHNEPPLMNWLDLVALGTVCDVVPLLGLNRAYVKQGLKVMASQQNLGLKNLMRIAKMETSPRAYHLGFVLGPRINACGRVGDAALGSKLLSTEDDHEAKQLAEKFDALNGERKEIENFVLLQAIEQVEKEAQEYPMAFAYGDDWHQGVIGIVAGKLRERYNMPAFVMSIEPDEVKGSARSVDGLDLGMLIISAKEHGVIKGGGGHTMAAGFSLTNEQIPEFKKFVGEYVLKHLGQDKIVPVLDIDCAVSLSAVNVDFATNLAQLEPFGTGNPEPQILLQNVRVVKPAIIGSGHVRCLLSSPTGSSVSAIAFRAADNEIGQALLSNRGDVYDVVGYIKLDEWQGRQKVQMIINDIMRK